MNILGNINNYNMFSNTGSRLNSTNRNERRSNYGGGLSNDPVRNIAHFGHVRNESRERDLGRGNDGANLNLNLGQVNNLNLLNESRNSRNSPLFTNTTTQQRSSVGRHMVSGNNLIQSTEHSGIGNLALGITNLNFNNLTSSNINRSFS